MRWLGTTAVTITLASALLSACASGGGSTEVAVNPAPVSAPPPPQPPPQPPAVNPPSPPPTNAAGFTAWAAVANPGAVALTGIGRERVGEGVNIGSLLDSSPVTLTLQTSALGDVTDIWIQNGARTVGVGGSIGISTHGESVSPGRFTHGGYPFWALDYITQIAVADPRAFGFAYQTYGTWFSSGPGVGAPASFGGYSVGAATPGASIPTSGAAVFNGQLTGQLAYDRWVDATMSLNVDFAARTARFASADWQEFGKQVRPGTALSGTLTYSAGQNALSGALTSANGAFSGPATAQFYGPAAQEAGGVIVLDGAGGTMVGAFGAKR